MTDVEQALARNQRLYEQYGKPLEQEHTGKFVAIGSDGRTILEEDDGQVLKQAIEIFGRGNFGFFRVGHRAVHSLR